MSDEQTGGTGSGPMAMGMEMARRMMAGTGGRGPDPMAMMHKMMGAAEQGGQTPPPMMQMCMGMCAEMLGAVKRTSDMAAFATPELHAAFEAWLQSAEAEALRLLGERGRLDQAALAAALGLGEDSAAFLMARLARAGSVSLSAELREASTG